MVAIKCDGGMCVCVRPCMLNEQLCVVNSESGNVETQFGEFKSVWGIVFLVSRFELAIERVAGLKFNSVN